MDCGDCAAVERPCAAHRRERASSHLSQSGCRTLTTPLQHCSCRSSAGSTASHPAALEPRNTAQICSPGKAPTAGRFPRPRRSPVILPVSQAGRCRRISRCVRMGILDLVGTAARSLSAGKRPIMGAVWSSLTFCSSCPLFRVCLLGCVASEHCEPVLQLHSSLCSNYSKFL